MLEGEQGGGGAGRDADLGVDVLDVVLGRTSGDVEPLSNLPVRASGGQLLQHLDLALAEAGWSSTPPALDALAGSCDHCFCCVVVESSGRDGAAQFLCRTLGLEGRAMGTRLCHRLEGVRGGQHSCGGGEIPSTASSVVAGAIESLVVPPSHLGHRLETMGGRQDPLGVVRVHPYLLPLR